MGRNFVEEAAGNATRDFAEGCAARCERNVQFLLCARDAHVKQSPFFLHPARLREGDAVGKDCLLDARDEDRVELKSLCRVERHEADGAALVIDVIRCGHE